MIKWNLQALPWRSCTIRQFCWNLLTTDFDSEIRLGLELDVNFFLKIEIISVTVKWYLWCFSTEIINHINVAEIVSLEWEF